MRLVRSFLVLFLLAAAAVAVYEGATLLLRAGYP